MLPNACPKPLPRVIDQVSDARAAAKHKRRVDAEVDARDGKRCRCCNRRGNPDSLTALGKIHRAHIQDASLLGEYSARNLCSLCWICHALEHAKKLWFVGKTANRFPMRFRIASSVVKTVFGDRALPAHVKVIRGE